MARNKAQSPKVSPINQFSVEWWDVERPTDYPLNARKWKPAAVTKVADSIKNYGWRQPIVVDEAGVIVIGHLRRAAARHAGLTQVPVHIAAGLSPEAIRGLRLADNRTHDEAEWDMELLAREFGELKALDFDLKSTAFSLREIDSLTLKPNPAEDDVPPVPEVPITKPGDLWLLGDHRLLCGDSTYQHDADKAGALGCDACITDPPYNVGKNYGNSTDDSQNAADYLAWNRRWFAVAREYTPVVVLTSGITNLPMWLCDVERTHKIISWVKENQNSRNYIGKTSGFNVWEPILVYGKSKKCVPRDCFTLPIGIQDDTGGHPCPKPVGAWRWLLENFTEPGDSVYEPFMGAGTTLIAAELMQRRAIGIEINPAYCDTTVTRWENLTGKKATRA